MWLEPHPLLPYHPLGYALPHSFLNDLLIKSLLHYLKQIESTIVSLIEVDQAMHAFTVVASLHALAAKLALTTLSSAHVEQMTAINNEFAKALKAADKFQAIQKDDQFHAVILEASQNPEIVIALGRLLPKIRRLELLKFNSFDGQKSIEQHQEIIECLSKGDKAQLPTLIENNWLSLATYLAEK